jgi:hypothetical protein
MVSYNTFLKWISHSKNGIGKKVIYVAKIIIADQSNDSLLSATVYTSRATLKRQKAEKKHISYSTTKS